METENIDNNKEEKVNESSTVFDTVMEVPFKIGEAIIENAPIAFVAAKDAIIEHSSNIVEGAGEVAGKVAGGIVNAIGETISNIDL